MTQALDRTRDLMRSLESLDHRMWQQGQQGQEGEQGQSGQDGQQGHQRGRYALRAGHQHLGFQPVGQNTAQQIQGQGRQGYSYSQVGQVFGLAGQLKHQPAQGKLEQHLMPGYAGQQGQPIVTELAVAHRRGDETAQYGGGGQSIKAHRAILSGKKGF